MRKQEGAVPTFPASTMNDAVEAYQKGDCRESIRRFSAALQQQEHPALLNGLGMAYLSCNQPRKRRPRPFERAVSISPGSAALHANAGTALYADNDYKSAERQFRRRALRIESPRPRKPSWARRDISSSWSRKEPEKALRQLSLVSGTDAASPEVLYNKALAMYQMGLTDDAGTDLGTYAREHPNDAEAQNALGVVMLRAGNYASAKAHLDRAIALRPEQGEYYYDRANVLKEQKEFKAAIDDYTRAVAFIRDLAGAYINRGDVRFLLRETEGACEQDLKKACELGECDRLGKTCRTPDAAEISFKIGEGGGRPFLEKGPSAPLPQTPSPPSPKTFVFIESLSRSFPSTSDRMVLSRGEDLNEGKYGGRYGSRWTSAVLWARSGIRWVWLAFLLGGIGLLFPSGGLPPLWRLAFAAMTEEFGASAPCSSVSLSDACLANGGCFTGGMLLTSALFALSHLPTHTPLMAALTFFPSLAFRGPSGTRHRSLWLCAAVHFWYNLLFFFSRASFHIPYTRIPARLRRRTR